MIEQLEDINALFKSLKYIFKHDNNNVRGCFDPITFTIRTNHNFKATIDSQNIDQLIAYSNYIHETTHYICFTGTVFGFEYNFIRATLQNTIVTLFKDNVFYDFGFPLVGFLPSLINKLKNNSQIIEKHKSLIHALSAEAYLSNIILGSKEYQLRSKSNFDSSKLPDPHFFISKANTYYPTRGLTTLENWARFNQTLFLYNDFIDKKNLPDLENRLTRVCV